MASSSTWVEGSCHLEGRHAESIDGHPGRRHWGFDRRPACVADPPSGLPKDFSVSVLIVQHLTSGFVQGFAEWLMQSTGFPVHVAAAGDDLLPGHAYLAADGVHLQVGMDR